MENTFRCLIFVLVAFSIAESINFYVSPTTFYDFDTNVKLVCRLSNTTDSHITKVEVLKIEKRSTKDRALWTAVAQIRVGGGISVKDKNLLVSGIAGNPEDSYLMVTWTKASPDKYGAYRCEGFGSSKTNTFVAMMSRETTIQGSTRNMHNLYELVRTGKIELDAKIKEVSDRTAKQEEEEEKNYRDASSYRGKLGDKLDTILTSLMNMSTKINAIEQSLQTSKYSNVTSKR